MNDVVTEVAPGVFRIRDTCNAYVIVSDRAAEYSDRTAIMIDFGSGLALEHLSAMGVDRVTDVLMTHHHRDQGQGLPRAVEAGIAIHVPAVEQDLFAAVNEMWRTRPISNDYNLRQDRFSLLESVPVAGHAPEYRSRDYHGVEVTCLPTPGHTTGSVTYLLHRDGELLAFTGDLIYAPGKVWSLAATQWSYTENEGPAMTVLSCYLLAAEEPSRLLPSHGDPIEDGVAALDLLAERMQTYVDSRRTKPWDLRERLDHPYQQLSEHLLLNTSSHSCSYVLLSDTGAAMIIDFGYDMITGLPAGTDRAARRPWLASLPALRRDFGVTRIEVALATHYHDDHVAGMNLLREAEGVEVWAPEHVTKVLEDPWRFDLPCLWHDPIPVDRSLRLGESVQWQEHKITVHDLPGHTLYAAAFEFDIDGVRVLVTGDQQEGLGRPGERRELLNYQYRNLFRITDYRRSAALYRTIAPGLMVSGHWEPRWVDEGYLQMLTDEGEELVDIHHELLPLDELDLGADGVLARIQPYRSRVPLDGSVTFTVELRNPYAQAERAVIRPVVPLGWRSTETIKVMLDPGQTQEVKFSVQVDQRVRSRSRVAVDVTIGDLRLGQHAEALVDVADDQEDVADDQGQGN